MKIFQKLSSLALAALVITSCGNPAKMAEKAEQADCEIGKDYN